MVIGFLGEAGGGLRNIGLAFSPASAAMMLGIFILAAVALVLVRQTRPANYPSRLPAEMPPILPVNLGERIFWMFASATAGICEELVYRGFGLCALRGIGMPAWVAVVLTSVAFVLVHGLWGLRRFWHYFIVGALYSGLFLWVHSLAPGMWIHTLYDMVFIFAG
jgi:membrane protease YdiL (CAAX protease family)